MPPIDTTTISKTSPLQAPWLQQGSSGEAALVAAGACDPSHSVLLEAGQQGRAATYLLTLQLPARVYLHKSS
jgi:hypothetical protein